MGECREREAHVGENGCLCHERHAPERLRRLIQRSRVYSTVGIALGGDLKEFEGVCARECHTWPERGCLWQVDFIIYILVWWGGGGRHLGRRREVVVVASFSLLDDFQGRVDLLNQEISE